MTTPKLEMKGAAITGQINFVRTNFGEDGYTRWCAALAPPVREIVEGTVLASQWYVLDDLVNETRHRICQLFYGGSNDGAWEMGRFSAEAALKGVYKVFIRFGSPNWVAGRATAVFTKFYRPGGFDIVVNETGRAVGRIVGFPVEMGLLALSIAGFIERAMELSGARDVSVEVAKAMSDGQPCTEFRVTWT